MPLFSSSVSINTQHETSWDTYLDSGNASTNYQGASSAQVNKSVTRGGTSLKRALFAFDLSDLSGRNIVSATLTIKTTSGFGVGSGTEECSIHLIDTSSSDPVYDEVTWNNRKSGTAWSVAGGDTAVQAGTFKIDWPKTTNAVATSDDITNLIKTKAGGMCFILIKTAETDPTLLKAAIAHDEDSGSTVADLPVLTINSTIDHRKVYNRHEMLKFMNKSRGLVGKATIPSLTK